MPQNPYDKISEFYQRAVAEYAPELADAALASGQREMGNRPMSPEEKAALFQALFNSEGNFPGSTPEAATERAQVRPMLAQLSKQLGAREPRNPLQVFGSSFLDNLALNIPSTLGYATKASELTPEENTGFFSPYNMGALAGSIAQFAVPGFVLGKALKAGSAGYRALGGAEQAAKVAKAVTNTALPALAGAQEVGRMVNEETAGRQYGPLDYLWAPAAQAASQRIFGKMALNRSLNPVAGVTGNRIMNAASKAPAWAAGATEGGLTGLISAQADDRPLSQAGYGAVLATGATLGGPKLAALASALGAPKGYRAPKSLGLEDPALWGRGYASTPATGPSQAQMAAAYQGGPRTQVAQALGSPPGAAAQAAPPAAPSAGAAPAASVPPIPADLTNDVIQQIVKGRAVTRLPSGEGFTRIPDDQPRIATLIDPRTKQSVEMRIVGDLDYDASRGAGVGRFVAVDPATGKPVALSKDELSGAEISYTTRIGKTPEPVPMKVTGSGWVILRNAKNAGQGNAITAFNRETGDYHLRMADGGWRLLNVKDGGLTPEIEGFMAPKAPKGQTIRGLGQDFEPVDSAKLLESIDAMLAGLPPDVRAQVMRNIQALDAGEAIRTGTKKVRIVSQPSGQPRARKPQPQP